MTVSLAEYLKIANGIKDTIIVDGYTPNKEDFVRACMSKINGISDVEKDKHISDIYNSAVSSMINDHRQQFGKYLTKMYKSYLTHLVESEKDELIKAEELLND